MCKKTWNILTWNWPVASVLALIFLLIVMFLAVSYSVSLDIRGVSNNDEKNQILTVLGIAFTVLAVLWQRKTDEYEKIVSNIKKIELFCNVWLEDLKTEPGTKWGCQLNWLLEQHNGTIERKTGKPICRYLYPHKFYTLDEGVVSNIPNKIGKEKLDEYIGSLVSVDNKIRHLNFMIEKLHFRDKLSVGDDEIKEIKGLIDGNNENGVIYTLSKDIAALKTKTSCLLKTLEN